MAASGAPNPQIIPPNQNPQGGSYTITQFTQVNQQAIPPSVWTPDLVSEYMKLLKDNDDKNRTTFENYQKRQNNQQWAGIVIAAAIVLFGLYLVAIGNAFGKDLVAATVLFMSGYLAGKGEARLNK